MRGVRVEGCSNAELNGLAQIHRVSIWVIIAGFVGACTHIYAVLVAVPLHMYCAFRLSRCLRIHIAALLAIEVVMLIPVANTLALLLINNRAGRALKAAGLPLGPMGISKNPPEYFNQSEALLKAIEARDSAASSTDEGHPKR